MSKVRRVLSRCVQAVRDRWNADTTAAAAMGWTVQRGRLGSRVYRDPRFDQLRQRNGEPLPEEQVARVRASFASGRWS